VILAITAVALAVLFIQPVRAYRAAQDHHRRAEASLARAKTDHAALARRVAESDTRAAMVAEARSLGFVFRGETPFIVVSK
jgi:Septum formation initiator